MSSRWMGCAPWILFLASPLQAADGVTVIKLSVQSQPAPVPVLKYRLLPELNDMQQGNAAQAYLKCFMEQNQLYFNKESQENREKWLACPLSELPPDTVDYGGLSAKQADFAARLDVCDWQILNQLKTEGVSLPVPDLQQLRMLVAVLKVRCRGQIKAGKLDDAIKTQQTMFALARHVGEHPTLIGGLVGIAIGATAIGPFEEMIQQPNCPNFYWALAQMPPSLADLRKSLQGERMFIEAEFHGLLAPERIWEQADIQRVRDKARMFVGIVSDQDPASEGRDKWVAERLKDEKWLADTRKQLIGLGLPKASVDKYPPEQVMFQTLLIKYRTVRDESEKWLNFPYWVAEAERMKVAKDAAPPSMEERFAGSMVAAYSKVHRAQARIDQRLAMLRVVESLRLHAAANSGKLPSSLKEVAVPLPVDPFNGKPFIYKLEEATAILQGTPPKSEEKNPAYNIRYEVTIRK